MIKKLAAAALACVAFTSVNATADQLDTVIQRGTLNCGVVLDFPPMGYFDADNEPAGFDVDYCNDLAEVLGVGLSVEPGGYCPRRARLNRGLSLLSLNSP